MTKRPPRCAPVSSDFCATERLPRRLSAAGSAIPNCASPMMPAGPPPVLSRAYAKFEGPGVYATTITQPRAFRDYLIEQLALLVADYGADIEVAVSDQEIPYPYVLESAMSSAAIGIPRRRSPATFRRRCCRRSAMRSPMACGSRNRASPCRSPSSTRCAPTIR